MGFFWLLWMGGNTPLTYVHELGKGVGREIYTSTVSKLSGLQLPHSMFKLTCMLDSNSCLIH